MATQQAFETIFDGNDLFLAERQSSEIESLFKSVHNQETYNRKDLLGIIRRINGIEVDKLSKDAQIKFQSLCGRVHTLNVNHMVDAIYDEAEALVRLRARW